MSTKRQQKKKPNTRTTKLTEQKLLPFVCQKHLRDYLNHQMN